MSRSPLPAFSFSEEVFSGERASFPPPLALLGYVPLPTSCSYEPQTPIYTILWALFALVLFLHISLEALDIRQSKALLYGKDAFALAHILVQIPPTEFQNLQMPNPAL